MTSPQPEPHSTNPFIESSFFSRCFFLWIWPLLQVGMLRPLEERDLPAVLKEDTSESGLHYINDLMAQQPNWSLFKILAVDYWKSMVLVSLLLITTMTARIVQALALGNLIEHFNKEHDHKDENVLQGCLWAGVLIVSGAILFLAKQRQYFETYHKGMQIRIGLVALIFDKSTRLPSGDQSNISAGYLSNLASNDVDRFLMASISAIHLPWGPLEAIAILIIGLRILGPAFSFGYILLALFLLLQTNLSKRFTQVRGQVASCTDARTSLIAQVIDGARVVKMNAWELELEKNITQIRSEELSKIHRSSRFKALNEAAYFVSSLFVSVVVFLVHIGLGGTLTPRNVFSSITLLNILQFTMTKQFPSGVMLASECMASSERIEKFLQLPEKEDLQVTAPNVTLPSNEVQDAHYDDNNTTIPKIELANLTCVWNGTKTAAVQDISMSLQARGLYCVVGQVGSGKTALLEALAGEINAIEGQVNRNYTSLAYSPQDAWIMNGTVRENIIMGLQYKAQWYDKVLHACALHVDIQQLAHGDATMLGDKGLRCSGGQRARISLARALYTNSDVLIFDDPLSAVDGKVARWLCQHAIEDLATRMKKCVVIATHQHQLLAQSAAYMVMKGGNLVCAGKYHECIEASNGLLSADALASSYVDGIAGKEIATKTTANICAADGDTIKMLASGSAEDNNAPASRDKDVVAERKSTGIVKMQTWTNYANAMGGRRVALTLGILFVATQTASLISIVQIGEWSDMNSQDQSSTTSISLILGLLGATIILAICRASLSFYFCIGASQRLHETMLRAVLRAQITFFDINPSGRLLNRFSADTGIADELLPLTIYDFLVGCFMALGGVATAMVLLPLTLVTLPPMAWYFFYIRTIFVRNTREIKRVESLARSPIFEMLGESISGIKSIRCNGASPFFREKFRTKQDAHSRAFFSFIAASRWFATRIEYITWFLLSFCSSMSLLSHYKGWLDVSPSILGLALTLILQLGGTNLPFIIRQSAEVVNQMISIERISEYGAAPSEATLHTKYDTTAWPGHTTIESEQACVRYRPDLPLVLKGVDFMIKPGMWCGVVGRTGSGKSTLVQALLRLLETTNGRISIGGTDISKMGLHQLRLAMSVLPQTPVLFDGVTLRENLDPLGDYSEDELWSALDDVQMATTISALPERLACVSTNFSSGQKQLLCLARAILRQSPMLILDEATANVDTQTEELLKMALKKRFSRSTIVAVAHRLDTVIDYDHIIVMNAGQVVESGSPAELLSHENGIFASMVNSTGDEVSEILRRRAALGRTV